MSTVPGAPSQVLAISGDSFAAVAWATPASDGGATITSYIVTPYEQAATPIPLETTTVAGSPPSTLAIVSGLTNGTVYMFTVAAVNANGTGTSSALAGPTTPAVPGPPPARYVTVEYAESLGLNSLSIQAIYGDAYQLYTQIAATPLTSRDLLIMWAMQAWSAVEPPSARVDAALNLLMTSNLLVPLTGS